MKQELDQEKYHKLACYTLAHSDPNFIHQHIVDAFHAQHASENMKPITIVFSLIGLYLYLEQGYSGREIQQVHTRLAKHKKKWIQFELPNFSGTITVSEVLAAPAGYKRDDMIRNWCQSVWDAWEANHPQIRDLVKANLAEFQE